jgi:hypothetical protein
MRRKNDDLIEENVLVLNNPNPQHFVYGDEPESVNNYVDDSEDEDEDEEEEDDDEEEEEDFEDEEEEALGFEDEDLEVDDDDEEFERFDLEYEERAQIRAEMTRYLELNSDNDGLIAPRPNYGSKTRRSLARNNARLNRTGLLTNEAIDKAVEAHAKRCEHEHLALPTLDYSQE